MQLRLDQTLRPSVLLRQSALLARQERLLFQRFLFQSSVRLAVAKAVWLVPKAVVLFLQVVAFDRKEVEWSVRLNLSKVVVLSSRLGLLDSSEDWRLGRWYQLWCPSERCRFQFDRCRFDQVFVQLGQVFVRARWL